MAVAVGEKRRREIGKLSTPQKRALDEWLYLNSGTDGGRRFVPGKIRRMPLDDLIELASDEALSLEWQERERRRCDSDLVYFVDNYGHLRPERGEAIPFTLWPEQREVLLAFIEYLRVVILKARQLGLTWLALHYAIWLIRTIDNFRTLALSKHGGDATKLVERARHINDLLPPFLRLSEDRSFRDSLSRFKTADGGEILSLTSSPAAARQETAGLAILDEAAYVKNKGFEPTWTAVDPTLGELGQAIVLATGNGPPQGGGDGAGFARLYTEPREGVKTIFLPDSVNPIRDAKWRAKARERYLSDEEFAAEHPLTEDEAFATVGGTPVYPLTRIKAAEIAGAEFDKRLANGIGTRENQLPPPADIVACGIDWGEQTFIVNLWPLERGGFYVMPGEISSAHLEPGEATRTWIETIREIMPPRGRADPLRRVATARFDAAGVQSMRTFMATVQASGHPLIEAEGVPFGKEIDERRRSMKRLTVNYLRRLFKRVAEGQTTQIIAISPRNKELLRQLRGLRFRDDDSGKVEKGDDHGPDALLAGVAPVAVNFIALLDEEEEGSE